MKTLMKDIKKAFLKKTLNLKAQKKSVEKSVSKRSFFDEKVIEKKLKEQKRKFESIKRINEEELKEARKSGDYKKVQEIKNVIRELKKSFKVASNNLESKKILLTRSNLKNLSIKTEEDKRKLAREIKLSKQKYRDLKNELQFELKEALKSGNKEEMNRIKRELNKIRNMYKEEARRLFEKKNLIVKKEDKIGNRIFQEEKRLLAKKMADEKARFNEIKYQQEFEKMK
jgi:hypothetical protein